MCYTVSMKQIPNTVEWNGTEWVVVSWRNVGWLTRTGAVVASLKSKGKVDAACEAMLKELL